MTEEWYKLPGFDGPIWVQKDSIKMIQPSSGYMNTGYSYVYITPNNWINVNLRPEELIKVIGMNNE